MNIEPIREILKAHVKAHYRVVNGKVVHIADYDTSKPQGTAATLHERTAIGKHKSGTHYLRATDAKDAEHIKAAADKLGIPLERRRAGANHHGRVGAYDHFHVQDPSHAIAIHNELKNVKEEPEGQGQKDHGNASAGGNPPKGEPAENLPTFDEAAKKYEGKGHTFDVWHGGDIDGQKYQTLTVRDKNGKHVGSHTIAHHEGNNTKAKEASAKSVRDDADAASKFAHSASEGANSHKLQEDDHQSYDQHTKNHLEAIQAHGEARDAHQRAMGYTTPGSPEWNHHEEQTRKHHDLVLKHNEAMGKAHGEIQARADEAHAASVKANKSGKPEDHAAAAKAHRHAAKIQYDSQVRREHERRAAEHEGQAEEEGGDEEGYLPAKFVPHDGHVAKVKFGEGGASGSAVLHPEHMEAIGKLQDGDSHSIQDETGTKWDVHRKGDDLHFRAHGSSGLKGKVPMPGPHEFGKTSAEPEDKRRLDVAARKGPAKPDAPKTEPEKQSKPPVGGGPIMAPAKGYNVGAAGPHLHQYPSGRWGFVGAVPHNLTVLHGEGRDLTDAEIQERGQAQNPAWHDKAKGYKKLVWDTPEEALQHAKGKGWEAPSIEHAKTHGLQPSSKPADAPVSMKPASEAPGHKIPEPQNGDSNRMDPHSMVAFDKSKAALHHATMAPNVYVKNHSMVGGKKISGGTHKTSMAAAEATKAALKGDTHEAHLAASEAHWQAAAAHEKAGNGQGNFYFSKHSKAQDFHTEAAKAHAIRSFDLKNGVKPHEAAEGAGKAPAKPGHESADAPADTPAASSGNPHAKTALQHATSAPNRKVDETIFKTPIKGTTHTLSADAAAASKKADASNSPEDHAAAKKAHDIAWAAHQAAKDGAGKSHFTAHHQAATAHEEASKYHEARAKQPKSE